VDFIDATDMKGEVDLKEKKSEADEEE